VVGDPLRGRILSFENSSEEKKRKLRKEQSKKENFEKKYDYLGENECS
jgi:hypothetical protein